MKNRIDIARGSNSRNQLRPLIDRDLVVVGLGEILWDLLPGGKKLGGAPANFAYHARAVGAHGCVASAVGQDDEGRQIMERLDVEGLDRTAVAVVSTMPTGTVSVSLAEDGTPSYVIHEGVAWDAIPESAEVMQLARAADAVCFGSLAQRCERSRNTICGFLSSVRSDCLRVFDLNLRQSYYSFEIVDKSLRTSEVLKLNDVELAVLAEMLDMRGNTETLLRCLLDRYPLDMVALTRGENGSVLAGREFYSDLPGDIVNVVDTVGAGDAFTAALTMGILRGHDIYAVHRHAARLAAYVCSQSGATPPIPSGLKEA